MREIREPSRNELDGTAIMDFSAGQTGRNGERRLAARTGEHLPADDSDATCPVRSTLRALLMAVKRGSLLSKRMSSV